MQIFLVYHEAETTATGQRTKSEIYQKGDLKEQVAAANQNALKLAAEGDELTQYYIAYLVYLDEYNLTQSEEALNKAQEALNMINIIGSLRLILEQLNSARVNRKQISPELKKKIDLLLPTIPQEKIPLIKVQLAAMEYFLKPPTLESLSLIHI